MAEAVSTRVRRILNGGSKAMRLSKNQDSDDTVQQGNVSTAVNAPSASVPDGSAPSASVPDSGNLGVNATQEHGVMDPDASMLSELGSRAPRFGSCTANDLSPIHNQATSRAQSIAPPEIDPSTPPRLEASGDDEVLATGMDLLDAQGAAANDASVVGIHILVPSPR